MKNMMKLEPAHAKLLIIRSKINDEKDDKNDD